MLLKKSPQSIMQLGMLFLILALFAQRFVHPGATFSESAVDGFNGFLIGVSIGLNGLAIFMMRRGRSAH
jgi:hypothetical protein